MERQVRCQENHFFVVRYAQIPLKKHLYTWILGLLTLSGSAQAIHKVIALQDQAKTPLNGRLYHYQSAEVIDILEAIEQQKRGHFKPVFSSTGRQNYGYNTDFHCVFFELSSSMSTPQRLILELEYSNIDEVELFEQKGGQIRSVGLSGDRYPFVQRLLSNNNYLFPISVRPQERASYYLLINHRHSILSFYLNLWQESAFVLGDYREYFTWGLFLGIVFLTLAFSLVMLLGTHDPIYGWYVVYLLFVLFHLLADAGLGFQYVWPNHTAPNTLDTVYLLAWGGLIAQLTFMQYFIHQSRQHRYFWWVYAVKVIVSIGLVVAIVAHVFGPEAYDFQWVSSFTNYFAVAMIVVAVLSLKDQWKQNDKMVRYYALALLFQFTGYLVASSLNFFQSMGVLLPFDVETYVVIGTTTLLDIVFFSFGLSYRSGMIRQRNIALQTEILTTKSLLAQRIIETLEEERRRIAQDLHDEIGATLSTAKGQLSTLTRGGLAAVHPHLNQAQQLIDRANQDVRTLSHNLMPRQFDEIGLSKSLEEAVRKVSQLDGVSFRFVGVGQVLPKPPLWEMQVFRIGIALIQDIIRHSQATEATIQLMYHADRLMLVAEDNGPVVRYTQAAGRELKHLQTRAQYLQAEVSVDSNEHGTTVVVDIPLHYTLSQ